MRYKLLAVVAVPLIALTVLAGVQVRRDIAAGHRAARVRVLATFADRVIALVHDLQSERDSSLAYLAGERRSGVADVAVRRELVDRSLAAFRADLRRIDPDSFAPLSRERLGAARELLSRIDSERGFVNGASAAGAARTELYFGDAIAALLDVDSGIAAESSDPGTARDAATLALLSRLKERSSQERGLILSVLSAGRFAPGQLEQLVTVIGTRESMVAQFEASARRGQRELYAAQLSSANLPRLASLRRAVLSAGGSAPPDGLSGPGGTAGALQVLTEEVERLRRVELLLAGDLAASSQAALSAARRSAFVDGSLTVLVLLLAAAISLLMARRIDARLVADQATLRRSMAGVFLSLARRSQDLVDGQLRLIDQLERNAEPEALEQLFKLDHLATRMRRNAESLIVLAGAEPARRWSQPLPLAEVVRASIGEVRDYQRVELLPIGDVGLGGHAAADLAHLLAELIENATSFSPPGTAVQVAGHEAASGFVLEIEDRGLGMSDEDLERANERLRDPPPIDAAPLRTLGLYVVARLAKRHGVKVQLRRSWCGGLTAMVLLPPGLTTWIRRRELVAPPPPGPGGPAPHAPATAAREPVDPQAPPAAPPPPRSPSEIRKMLSSYRSGLERGRRTAAGLKEAAGPAGPAGRGHLGQNGSGGGQMAPRRDDDAAQ